LCKNILALHRYRDLSLDILFYFASPCVHIPQFARIAQPITDLTAMKSPNVLPWGDAQEAAFKRLKNSLVPHRVLGIPVIGKPSELHTDASALAVGA